MRRALILCGALALAALLFLFLRPHPERAAFLPEAQNDFVLGVVGLPGGAPAPESASPVDGVPSRAEAVPAESSAASEAGSAESESGEPENTAPLPEAAALPAGERSVNARPERESYPVGTGEIALVVTNRTENDLIYTHWFDFRRVEGDAVVPLTPRAGLMANPDDVNAERVLHGGETVTITLPIDLFDEPLPPGTYRAAQLSCFADTGGQALACSEITADFVIAES